MKEFDELVNKKPKDLNEAYSHLGIRKRKQLLKVLEEIVNDAERYMHSKKAMRKPRKKKNVSTASQVSKVNYQKESPEFKLTSINPTAIVGSSELYLFNTKYRRVAYLVSSSKTGFTVKGTTVQDVDLEKSFQKTIRKPDEFFNDFLSFPKVKSRKQLEALKTKTAKTTGRINGDTIILKVY